MKLRITLKDPDGVWESVQDAARNSLRSGTSSLSTAERNALTDSRREGLLESIAPWVEYNEYVTIEIDTDTGTAIVIPITP